MLAGWLLGNKGWWVQLSRTELGLTLNSRSAILGFGALRLGISLGARHSAAESKEWGHLGFPINFLSALRSEESFNL